MKIIVSGGRDFSDYEHVKRSLDILASKIEISEIVQGGASGVDSLAKRWAEENYVECTEFKADWDRHGRAAGPIRNEEMAKEGDILARFPGGRGTANMERMARKHFVPIVFFDES